jgi:hypothetical protein
VEFNDRSISAEGYVAQLVDELKNKVHQVEEQFRRPRVRDDIRDMLDRASVELCMDMYWRDERLMEMMTRTQRWTAEDWTYWELKMGIALFCLKCGGSMDF